MNSREEVTGGFVVAGGDGAKVFELEEEVLDEVSVFVAFIVVSAGYETG
jgi:hypothetical protein